MTLEFDEVDKAWDAQSHTPEEYRREIRELRERCLKYAQDACATPSAREAVKCLTGAVRDLDADIARARVMAQEHLASLERERLLWLRAEERAAHLRAADGLPAELSAFAGGDLRLAALAAVFYVLHGHPPDKNGGWLK